MKHDPGRPVLRPGDVPPPEADFDATNEFGHTFDGYDYAESQWPDRDAVSACCELGERVRAALTPGADDPTEFTLDDLRAALFIEMRKARLASQWVDFPDEAALAYYSRLIECIRQKL